MSGQVSQAGVDPRKALVNPNHPQLTIERQCQLLQLTVQRTITRRERVTAMSRQIGIFLPQ